MVVAWALVAGLTACRDYDFDLWQNDDATASGDNAYMSFSFAIAGEKIVSTRAASIGEELPPLDSPDFGPYSFTWEEEGGDPINKVVAYVFYEKDGAFVYETTKEFSASDLQYENGAWRLKEPFNTTAGKKKVFVVVNPTASVKANINAKLTRGSDDTPSEYEKFDKFNEYLHSAGVHTFATDNYPTSHVPQSRADELVTNGGILMTGEAVETTIQAGVEKATVQSTAANNPKITVERAAARVLVTMPGIVEANNIEEVKKLYTEGRLNMNQVMYGGSDRDLIKVAYVTDITWRVAQGAKDFYFIKHKSAQDQKFLLGSYYNDDWMFGKDYKEYNEVVPGPDIDTVSLSTEEMPNPPQALPEYGDDGKPITDIWNEVYPLYASYTKSLDYSGLWKTPKRPVERGRVEMPTGDERGELHKLKAKELPEIPYSNKKEEDLNKKEKRERDRVIQVRDSLIKINKELDNKSKEYAEKTYIKREKDVLKTVQNDYEYVLPTSPMPQYANNAYVIIKAKIIPLYLSDAEYNTTRAIYKEQVYENGDWKTIEKWNEDFAFSYDDDGGFYYQPEQYTFTKEPFEGMVNIYLKGGYAYWCVPINPSNRFKRLRNDKIDSKDGSVPQEGEGPFWGADVAPIMRNAYYHLQIGHFRRIGLNWNPFVPYPHGTITSATSNPHNPDPRPSTEKDKTQIPTYLPNDALKNNVFKNLENPQLYDVNDRRNYIFYKGDEDYTAY